MPVTMWKKQPVLLDMYRAWHVRVCCVAFTFQPDFEPEKAWGLLHSFVVSLRPGYKRITPPNFLAALFFVAVTCLILKTWWAKIGRKFLWVVPDRTNSQFFTSPKQIQAVSQTDRQTDRWTDGQTDSSPYCVACPYVSGVCPSAYLSFVGFFPCWTFYSPVYRPACYLSVCLPACLPACLSLCLCIFLLWACFPSVCLFPCLLVCVCLPACLPAYLPACLSACVPVCLPVCLPACLSVCLCIFLLWACFPSVCLFACLLVCLPACLSVCLPVCLSVCLPVSLSVHFSSVGLLSVCVSICLSVGLPACLSVCLA